MKKAIKYSLNAADSVFAHWERSYVEQMMAILREIAIYVKAVVPVSYAPIEPPFPKVSKVGKDFTLSVSLCQPG